MGEKIKQIFYFFLYKSFHLYWYGFTGTKLYSQFSYHDGTRGWATWLEISTQYPVNINYKTYFIDISIIKYAKYDNPYEIKQVKKSAIECDCHDFHSSKDQIEKDNIRTREIISDSWQVIRYSGKEKSKLTRDYSKDVILKLERY